MNQLKYLALVCLLLTLLLLPFRASLSQDDAVYAKFAVDLTKDYAHVHPLNLAGVWTQSLFGSKVLKIFPNTNPILVLTSLTWVIFWILIFACWFKTRLSALVLLSYFLFPVWVQYGASFLTDVYTGFLICALWILTDLFITHRIPIHAWKHVFFPLLSVAVFAVLTGIQYQSYLALPLGWGLALIFRRGARDAWFGYFLILSSFLGLLAYALLPRSILQADAFYWLIHQSGPEDFVRFVFLFLQLVLAVGIYLIPFVPWTHATLKKAPKIFAVQVFLFLLLLFVSPEILSAGVLFTGYLPKFVGALLVSSGVWGLYAVYDLYLTRKDQRLLTGVILGSLVLITFNAFRIVQDIRYSLVLSLPFFFLLAKHQVSGVRNQLLGGKWFYFAPVVLISLLVNRYSLDTTDARWRLAQELESQSVDPFQISAGYGRDVYVFEPSCTQAALRKIAMSRIDSHLPLTKKPEFYNRIMLKAPRVYEDEAQPHYLIKPKKVFGKEIVLTQNVREGQSNEPMKIYDYSIFGLPNAVAVIDTGQNIAPWCFQ